MDIKETGAMRVLSAARRLTIPEIRSAAADLTMRIAGDASRRGFTASGPWTFIAHNLPRDGRTPFHIRFCLPVEGPETVETGEFELVALEPIMVASAIYQGSLRGLFTRGYAPLVAEIEASRHVFSGESREIYHHWGAAGSGYQKIELQFGLAR